ncbi:MAG: hypothetical protein F2667_00300 [Actinobacteria bacterium]|nr:hypothetical protein [Actinomycetota bacterium]
MSSEEEIGIRVSIKDRVKAARELVDLDGKVSHLGTSARHAGTAAAIGSRGFDTMARGAARMGRAIGIGAVAALGAGAVAIAGFVRWVGIGSRSLMRIETIGAQTNAVIKSTGGVANVSRKGVDNLAGSLESLTGIEAETTTEGANTLLTFTKIRNGVGKNNKIFDQAVRTMTDFSVATGRDAQGAAIMLGKALNDPIKGLTALGKVGVTFTDQQKKSIETFVEQGKIMKAQKVILGELNTEYGGSAKAFGATDAGKIARFGHAWGNLQETIASGAAPTIGRLSKYLVKEGVPATERWGRAWNREVAPNIRHAITDARRLWRVYQDNGLDGVVRRIEKMTGTQGRLTPVLRTARQVGRDLATVFTRSIIPAFDGASGAAFTLLNPLSYADDILGFMADHTTLTKNAFIGLIAVLTIAKGVMIAKNIVDGIQLIRLMALTPGTIAYTVAQSASAIATGAMTAATWLWTAAQTVASVATTAWTAAMWLLNAAFLANPIGAVILVVVALVAAFVVAYKKSETFRTIVDATWSVIKKGKWLLLGLLGPFGLIVGAFITAYKHSDRFRGAVDGLWGGVLKPFGAWVRDKLVGAFRLLGGAYLTMASLGLKAFRMLLRGAFSTFNGILTAADKALGWLPKWGDKIGAARSAFDAFGDSTIDTLDKMAARLDLAKAKLDGLGKPRRTSLTIDVRYNYTGLISPTRGRPDEYSGGAATGGPRPPGNGPRVSPRVAPRLAMPPDPVAPEIPATEPLDWASAAAAASAGSGSGEPKVVQVILGRKVLAEAVVGEVTSQQARQ